MTPGLWVWPDALVLASGSATRRHLLESAGVPVLARPSGIDERAVEEPLGAAGQPASAIALALARAKALDVGRMVSDALVLGGDQTLSVDGRQLHKPSSMEAARHQLAALSGRPHELNSAVALVRSGVVLFETVVSATLSMRPLSPAFIDSYVEAVGESVCDSVGAYKLEGLGIHLFDTIQGDQSTIMGLPLLPVLDALRCLGALKG